MSHQSRLPGVRAPVTPDDLLDQRTMAGLRATQAPERVDGRDLGRFFADEFAGPLGLDVWIGLPDEQHHRVSTMLAGPGVLVDPVPDSTDPLRVLTHNPLLVVGAPEVRNSTAFRRADLAAVGAYVTARSMARFYACLAEGVSSPAASTVERGPGPAAGSGSPTP